MSRHDSLRASDADRDAVVDRLRVAAGEGRLEADELEQRVHRALRARTYGELRRLVADLPGDGGPPARRAAWRSSPVKATAVAGVGLAVAMTVAFALVALMAVLLLAGAAVWMAFVLMWVASCTVRRHLRSGHGRQRAFGPRHARRIGI